MRRRNERLQPVVAKVVCGRHDLFVLRGFLFLLCLCYSVLLLRYCPIIHHAFPLRASCAAELPSSWLPSCVLSTNEPGAMSACRLTIECEYPSLHRLITTIPCLAHSHLVALPRKAISATGASSRSFLLNLFLLRTAAALPGFCYYRVLYVYREFLAESGGAAAPLLPSSALPLLLLPPSIILVPVAMLLALMLLAPTAGFMLPAQLLRHSRSRPLPYSRRRDHDTLPSTSVLQVIPSPSQGVIEGFSYAFIGGTVGVMSVALLLELRKAQDISSEACPYW